MKYFVVIVSSCVLIGFLNAHAADEPKLEICEDLAIKYRLVHTQQGYVRFRVTNKIHQQPAEFVYETTYDSTRIVQKCRSRLLGKQEWGEPTSILLTPKEIVLNRHPKTAIQRFARNDTTRLPESSLRVLRPQLSGMDFNGINSLDRAQLDSVMIRPNARTTPIVASESIGGVQIVRLEYKTKLKEAEVSVWLVPTQGYSVLKAVYRNPKTKVSTTVECKNKQYPTSNIWYPARLTKTLRVNEEVKGQQIVEVEDARFGERLDASQFTINSMGLSPGRLVGDYSSKVPALMIWDGKKLTTSTEIPTTSLPPSTYYNSSIWIIGAIGFGIVGILCLLVLKNRIAKQAS